MRPLFQILGALVILSFGGVAGFSGIEGILDGSVVFPSKYQDLVFQEVSPKSYWACIAFWLIMCAGFVWLALVNIIEALRGE